MSTAIMNCEDQTERVDPKPLKVGYFNIRGLDLLKLGILVGLLTSSFDLIFVSESWFCRESDYSTHPSFITHSPRSLQRKDSGRANGGILVLGTAAVKRNCSIILCEEFMVGLKIGGSTLVGTYLPPSLPLDTIEKLLLNLPHVDFFFGDINVRLGAAFHDKQVTAKDRRDVLFQYFIARELHIQKTADQSCSRNDHVFSRLPCSWIYRSIPGIHSDHEMMDMNVEIQSNISSAVPVGDQKYFLRSLSNPFMIDSVGFHFDSWFPQVPDGLSTCNLFVWQNSAKLKSRDVQAIVDTVYGSFIDYVNILQDEMFPKYDVQAVKFQPLNLKCVGSEQEIIRLFKASQRKILIQNPIKSRNPDLDPLDECFSHYNATFNPEDVPSPNTANPDDPVTIDWKVCAKMNSSLIDSTAAFCSSNKAPGDDGLTVRLLKVLFKRSIVFSSSIELLFKLFVSIGVTPTVWMDAKLHLLQKDKENPYADKTRPIALSQMLRRIFEKCLFKIWMHEKEPWSKTHALQAGFKNGYSTMTHLLVSDTLSKQGLTVNCFLDICQAYDRTPWSKLKEKLTSRQCPEAYIRIIESLMLRPASIKLVVNGVTHPTRIPTKRGLFQGSIISPLLFSIFIDDLAEKTNAITPTLLFADDIVIKARRHAVVQEALNVCETWSKENDMTWSIPKCGVTGLIASATLKLDGEALPRVESYKYLGVPHFPHYVDWAQLVVLNCTKHDKFLLALSDQAVAWPAQARVVIWRCFHRPILEYCLPIFYVWQSIIKGAKFSKALRDQVTQARTCLKESYSNGLAFMIGRNDRNSLYEVLTGVGSIECRMKSLYAGLSFHIKRSDIANPLRSISIASQNVAFPVIVKQCSSSPLLSEFLALWPGAPIDSDLRENLRSFLSEVKRKSLRDDYLGNLRRYIILPMSPTYDHSLAMSREAINWRVNRLFARRICSQCQKPFHRGHVANCQLLQHHHLSQAITESEEFVCMRSIVSSKMTTAHNFNALDFCLNSNQKENFRILVEALAQSLVADSSDPVVASIA
jgi:hypothetical protein